MDALRWARPDFVPPTQIAFRRHCQLGTRYHNTSPEQPSPGPGYAPPRARERSGDRDTQLQPAPYRGGPAGPAPLPWAPGGESVSQGSTVPVQFRRCTEEHNGNWG